MQLQGNELLVLLERVSSSSDQDHVYMGLTDLCALLAGTQPLPPALESRVESVVLAKIVKGKRDVQEAAVACMVSIARSFRSLESLSSLAVKLLEFMVMFREDEQDTKSACSTSLKHMLSHLSADAAKLVFLPLLGRFVEVVATNEERQHGLDVLAAICDTMGESFPVTIHRDILDLCSSLLLGPPLGRIVTSKSIACMRSVSVHVAPAALERFILDILGTVATTAGDRCDDVFRIVSTLAKSAGHLFPAALVHQVIRVLLQWDGAPENRPRYDQRELCLSALESVLRYCPPATHAHSDILAHISQHALSYDPNYVADSEGEEEEEELPVVPGMSDGGGDGWLGGEEEEDAIFVSESEEDRLSDDEDGSWQVRRQAIKCLRSILEAETRPNSALLPLIARYLFSRWNERQEHVAMDVFHCFSLLCTQCVNTHATGLPVKQVLCATAKHAAVLLRSLSASNSSLRHQLMEAKLQGIGAFLALLSAKKHDNRMRNGTMCAASATATSLIAYLAAHEPQGADEHKQKNSVLSHDVRVGCLRCLALLVFLVPSSIYESMHTVAVANTRSRGATIVQAALALLQRVWVASPTLPVLPLTHPQALAGLSALASNDDTTCGADEQRNTKEVISALAGLLTRVNDEARRSEVMCTLGMAAELLVAGDDVALGLIQGELEKRRGLSVALQALLRWLRGAVTVDSQPVTGVEERLWRLVTPLTKHVEPNIVALALAALDAMIRMQHTSPHIEVATAIEEACLAHWRGLGLEISVIALASLYATGCSPSPAIAEHAMATAPLPALPAFELLFSQLGPSAQSLMAKAGGDTSSNLRYRAAAFSLSSKDLPVPVTLYGELGRRSVDHETSQRLFTALVEEKSTPKKKKMFQLGQIVAGAPRLFELLAQVTDTTDVHFTNGFLDEFRPLPKSLDHTRFAAHALLALSFPHTYPIERAPLRTLQQFVLRAARVSAAELPLWYSHVVVCSVTDALAYAARLRDELIPAYPGALSRLLHRRLLCTELFEAAPEGEHVVWLETVTVIVRHFPGSIGLAIQEEDEETEEDEEKEKAGDENKDMDMRRRLMQLLCLAATSQPSQIREVVYGPITKQEDHGVPLRKLAFQVIGECLDRLCALGATQAQKVLEAQLLVGIQRESHLDIVKTIHAAVCKLSLPSDAIVGALRVAATVLPPTGALAHELADHTAKINSTQQTIAKIVPQ